MAVWRTLFRRATDGLVEGGALRAIRLESIVHPEHPGAGRVLSAQSSGAGGEVYGVSQVEEIPSRSLSATDLDGFELDIEQFGKMLRSNLGIQGVHPAWDKGPLLNLGRVQVGVNHLHFFYAVRECHPPFGEQVKRVAGATPVVLIPAARTIETDLSVVRLQTALPTRQETLREALVASCLEDRTPAVFLAQDGIRLVVDLKLKKVWIDGVEIDTLKPDSHPFNFVTLMAKSAPQPVSSHEISAKLSNRDDENTAARQAKKDAKTFISQAMTAAGRKWSDDPFPSGGPGCYRCALTSFVKE